MKNILLYRRWILKSYPHQSDFYAEHEALLVDNGNVRVVRTLFQYFVLAENKQVTFWHA